MVRFNLVKTALMLSIVALSLGAAAAPWAVNGPRDRIVTLVLTGNYKSPRLLAELIQNESRQPYILLPTRESGDSRIFFCPPKSKGSASLEIPEKQFNSFIRFINPRRIVVLGNAAYIQPKYLQMLDHAIPVVTIDCVDWQRNAEELTDLLNLSDLADNYKRLREVMLNDSRIYRPVSRPAPKPVQPAEAPMEEKAVEEAPAAAEETPVVQETALPAAE